MFFSDKRKNAENIKNQVWKYEDYSIVTNLALLQNNCTFDFLPHSQILFEMCNFIIFSEVPLRVTDSTTLTLLLYQFLCEIISHKKHGESFRGDFLKVIG